MNWKRNSVVNPLWHTCGEISPVSFLTPEMQGNRPQINKLEICPCLREDILQHCWWITIAVKHKCSEEVFYKPWYTVKLL